MKLPDVDGDATTAEIIHVIEAYQDARKMIEVGIMPPVTTAYDRVGGRPIGKVSDTTEATVSRKQRLPETVERMDEIVSSLPPKQRRVVRRVLEGAKIEASDPEQVSALYVFAHVLGVVKYRDAN